MRSRLAIAMLTASMLAPAWVSPLQAQRRAMPRRAPAPLMALALHDLTFGTVLPGIPSTVSVNDPLHAGLFEITGPANASVRVELVLPTDLVSSEGALLPITFGPADGSVQVGGRDRQCHPHRPVIQTLGADGRLFIRLGGTVKPGSSQAGGRYRATISLTVYNLGS